MIVNMKLTTVPGVPNVNGVVYFEDEYKPCLERIENLIKEGTCYVMLKLNVKETSMDISNAFGRVVKKYPDSVDIEVTNPDMKKMIEEGMNLDNKTVGMFYLGEIHPLIWNQGNYSEVTNMKFIYYHLQDKISPRE